MFEDFEEHRVVTPEATIFVRTGGHGPPLLLLHGYPQSHVIWHAVAPRLAEKYSLFLPDLRGYGASDGPLPDAAHVRYSKRAMAQDMIDVMSSFGYERFFLGGHDRGGRVAYRLALDHPERVTRLALLDLLPTLDVWENIHGIDALRSYHWLLLAQPAPFPERLIGNAPDFFLSHVFQQWLGPGHTLDPAAVAAYERDFRKPNVRSAACEDYRAGATVDLEHDRLDRVAQKSLRCPLLLIWGRHYLGRASGAAPAEIWRRWARDVREVVLDCGHFVAEEEPLACAKALDEFFSAGVATTAETPSIDLGFFGATSFEARKIH